VRPETADFLDKARQCLDDAGRIAASIALYHIAAREAYLAAYHAPEAYIFEHTGRTTKTHRGLRSEFARLARTEPRIDPEYLTVLAAAYEYKSIADYGVGPSVPQITARDAAAALDTARRFIQGIAALLA